MTSPLDRLRAALIHADQHAWPRTNVTASDLAWALKLPNAVAALADELDHNAATLTRNNRHHEAADMTILARKVRGLLNGSNR